jgi:DNA-binding response OmpR family regulator
MSPIGGMDIAFFTSCSQLCFFIHKMDTAMIQSKILFATRNSTIEKEARTSFLKANFECICVKEITEAIGQLKNLNPSAFILDCELLETDSEDINRIVGEISRKTAFVVLSNRKKKHDRIQVLEEGADDCFSQSDRMEELVAKVKALIRRIEMVENAPRSIQFKDIEINLDTHEVLKAGKPIDLTYTQFKLLYLLISHRDTIFSRDEILEKVWGENVYVTDRTVDVHVKRLREKLGEKTQSMQYIQTIHGLGYRFA